MKVNRRLILLIILVLTMAISVGCSKAKKTEGVSQEFYDDMIFVSENLIKSTREAKVFDLDKSDILNGKGYEKISKYEEDYSQLNNIEKSIFDTIDELYFLTAIYYDMYYKDLTPPDKDVKQSAETFAKLMEIEVDVDKLILK